MMWCDIKLNGKRWRNGGSCWESGEKLNKPKTGPSSRLNFSKQQLKQLTGSFWGEIKERESGFTENFLPLVANLALATLHCPVLACWGLRPQTLGGSAARAKLGALPPDPRRGSAPNPAQAPPSEPRWGSALIPVGGSAMKTWKQKGNTHHQPPN